MRGGSAPRRQARASVSRGARNLGEGGIHFRRSKIKSEGSPQGAPRPAGQSAQNSFRLPPASRSIRADTGSFTLLRKIMAAMI